MRLGWRLLLYINSLLWDGRILWMFFLQIVLRPDSSGEKNLRHRTVENRSCLMLRLTCQKMQHQSWESHHVSWCTVVIVDVKGILAFHDLCYQGVYSSACASPMTSGGPTGGSWSHSREGSGWVARHRRPEAIVRFSGGSQDEVVVTLGSEWR